MNPDNPQPVIPVLPTDAPRDVSELAKEGPSAVVNEPVNFPTPPSNHKSPLILIAIVLVVIALLAAIAYAIGMQFVGNKGSLLGPYTPPSATACTEEAKLCPDGSAVGRTGPNCEFEACPVVNATPDPTTDWKTFTNNDLSFKYPTDWKEGSAVGSIIANVDGASINAFTKDMPMYNECMVLGKTETIGDKLVKYYGYSYSGEACSNKAYLGNYEAWITKAGGEGYQPGIIYSYNTTSYSQSFEIFKQILSTFQFTK